MGSQVPKRSVVQRIAKVVFAFVAVLLIAALILAGIILGPTTLSQIQGKVTVETLQVASVTRTYRVYRPASVSAHPGLVIVLHGARSTGFVMEIGTNFDSQVDRLRWIAAYPDGISDGWDAYGCCRHEGVDDVAFISRLIDRLTATDKVDPSRVSVSGVSRGGMMAYRLACELSSKIAAIAPVEGNMADKDGTLRGVDCQPTRPVSVLVVHGTADREVPIAGGKSLVYEETIAYAPLKDIVERWREIDRCGPGSRVDERSGSTTTTWSCQGGTVVAQLVVSGGVHSWPGTPLGILFGFLTSGFQSLGPESSVDGSKVIADFFEAHASSR